MSRLSAALFSPGRVVATPAALALAEDEEINLLGLLARHLAGDWGDVGDEDSRLNDQALVGGARLLSAYGPEPYRIWIITDAETDACPACVAGIGRCEPELGEWHGGIHFRTDQPERRLSTSIMLPSEY